VLTTTGCDKKDNEQQDNATLAALSTTKKIKLSGQNLEASEPAQQVVMEIPQESNKGPLPSANLPKEPIAAPVADELIAEGSQAIVVPVAEEPNSLPPAPVNPTNNDQNKKIQQVADEAITTAENTEMLNEPNFNIPFEDNLGSNSQPIAD
jgi:hypothetical protein